MPFFFPGEGNSCRRPVDPVNASQYAAAVVGGPARLKQVAAYGGFGGGLAWCQKPPWQDPNITARAQKYLEAASKSGEPFFLAVGFHKPHLPFQAPPEFFDLYPLEDVDMPVHKTFPTDAPSIAFHDTGDSPSPWIPLPDWKIRETRRAYKAAISFMDSQVGALMGTLGDLGFAGNTVVLFHADHGWQLGEHGVWRKMTNFELGVRVPLIFRVPWAQRAGAAPRTAARTRQRSPAGTA
eukprot:gene10406-8738_t